MTAESQLLKTINQFIGPCAHGSDPYDRCEDCEWLSPIEAKVVALQAEVERVTKARDYDAKVIPDLMRELEEAKLLLSVKMETVEAQRQLLADNGALLIESKAEVERLKESVANLDALYVSRTDALRESEAEVARLREAARQVHALSMTEERDYRCVRVVEQLRKIHKITKGMVA